VIHIVSGELLADRRKLLYFQKLLHRFGSS